MDSSDGDLQGLREIQGLAVGKKQSLKLAREGKAKLIYLAADADEEIRLEITLAARANGIPISMTQSKSELGRAVGIRVDAACCTIPKPE